MPCALVNGNPRAAGGPLRHTICGLLTLYGPWGGIVATKSGKCLSGAQYALSCKLVNLPVRVYYVEDTAAMQVRAIFQKQYGTFSYEHLPKTTYAQTFAQMYRCDQGDYVRLLQKQGVRIWSVEFFYRIGSYLNTVGTQALGADTVTRWC